MSYSMPSGFVKIDLSWIGLIFYGGPLALILSEKNHLKLRKIQRIREFFINTFGIFEVDSETEYRYGKQPVSFYNSHGSTIPKNIVKKVTKLYNQGKFMGVRQELEQIYPELINQKFRSIYEVFQYVVELTRHKAIDIDTEKFMPYYRAYNPISIKRLNEVCQEGRKAIESLDPSIKAPFPIIIAVILGILGLAFIQNGPKYVREAVSYFDKLKNAPIEETIEPSQFILGLNNIIDPSNMPHFILYLQHLIGG